MAPLFDRVFVHILQSKIPTPNSSENEFETYVCQIAQHFVYFHEKCMHLQSKYIVW